MERILVVDDAELNRDLLSGMLSSDYRVATASDGQEALEKLAEDPENIAALLLDLYMPRMDGFTVIDAMRRQGLTKRIPVLIISSEYAVEVETRCFELGVSDFIHKPFESSIVRNRVRNAIELFSYKNQLEQTVEQQAEAIKRQSQIIQLQEAKLQEEKAFGALMMEFRSAIAEVETKLQVLNTEFSLKYNRNPFESIKSRLKSPESIFEKLERKGYPLTVDSIRDYLTDVAGIRVICSFPDDIYRLAELFLRQDDIILLRKKDYIENPKDNGYRSLHLILNVPIFLSGGKKYMKAEVQFRTIAMDFWASVEHKLKYKKHIADADEIARQLKTCADSIAQMDSQMQEIRNRIDFSKE